MEHPNDEPVCELTEIQRTRPGILRGLQAMQYKYAPGTTQELIEACKGAFDPYDPCNIDSNFIPLQNCLECFLLDHRGIRYKQPHVGKEKKSE